MLVLDRQRVVSALGGLQGRSRSPCHHRDNIMAFVACVHDLVEERGELAFPLLTGHPQFRSSGYYAFILNQQCEDILYPLDYRPTIPTVTLRMSRA